MDLSSIFNNLSSNRYTPLKTSQSKQKDIDEKAKLKNDEIESTVVKKGETGYMESMDFDDDGEISLQEFNKYCKENNIGEKDKLRLLSSIRGATTNENLNLISDIDEEELEKVEKQLNFDRVGFNSDDDDEEENEVVKLEKPLQIIFAQKGEDKYDEDMDTNGDKVVTYTEYMQYCAENSPAESEYESRNKIQEAYSKSNIVEPAKFKVEVDA